MRRLTLYPRIHIAVFLFAIALWTVALLLPVPNESANKALGSPLWAFLFGKSLHVCAYLFLTVLGGTAFFAYKRWFWILPLLMLHGAVSEFLQQFVDRTASVRDVLLDTLGILLGSCVLLWWARVKHRQRDLAAASNPEQGPGGELSRKHRLPTAVSTATKKADNR